MLFLLHFHCFACPDYAMLQILLVETATIAVEGALLHVFVMSAQRPQVKMLMMQSHLS